MQDHRIEQQGQRLDYTCENRAFRTRIEMGLSHGEHQVQGSVFNEPLYFDGQYSLWLEHVLNKRDENEQCYWLMWYQNGQPTVPLSSIMRRDDVIHMQTLLASLIP